MGNKMVIRATAHVLDGKERLELPPPGGRTV